jgi:hypothetical protein
MNPWDVDVNRALICDVKAELRLEVLSLRGLALDLRDTLELAICDTLSAGERDVPFHRIWANTAAGELHCAQSWMSIWHSQIRRMQRLFVIANNLTDLATGILLRFRQD